MPYSDPDDLKMAYAEKEMIRQKIRRRSSMELILKVYAFFGALTTLFGVFYVAYILLDIEFSREVQMGLMIAFSGAVMSIVSLFGVSYLRDRASLLSLDQSGEIMKMALINEWTQFESIARSVSHVGKEDPRYLSVRRLLEGLKVEGRIDDRDFRALLNALEMRNRIVHGVDAYSIELSELDYSLDLLRKIVSRLEDSSSSNEAAS